MTDRAEEVCYAIENFMERKNKGDRHKKTAELVLGPLRATIFDEYVGDKGKFVGRFALVGRGNLPITYYAATGDPMRSIYWVPRRVPDQPAPQLEFAKTEDMTRYGAYATLLVRAYGVDSPPQSNRMGDTYYREIISRLNAMGVSDFTPNPKVFNAR